MTAYSIALFLHIIGAIGLFVALGLEWAGLRHLQRATTADEVRTWLSFATGKSQIDGPSMIFVLIPGFYMARAAHRAPWIAVTLATIVAILALGLAITRPRVRAMTRAQRAEPGTTSMLMASLRVRLFMMFGIIGLMTFKPDMRESLLVIAVATTLGIVSALPLFRTQRAQWQAADQRSEE